MKKIGYDIITKIINYLDFNDILNFMIINKFIYNNISNKLLQIKRIEFLNNYEKKCCGYRTFPNFAVCYVCMKIKPRKLFTDNQWKKTIKLHTRRCINCLPKNSHFQSIKVCNIKKYFCFKCEKWLYCDAFEDFFKI